MLRLIKRLACHAWGGIASLILVACTNDLESLYRAADVPVMPSLPDGEHRAACEACARANCTQAWADCVHDTACRALLSCRGTCSDPACTLGCVAEHGYSAWYEDLWACVLLDACPEACASGENFACVDAYQAPKAERNRERFPVRFRFKNPRTGLAYAYPGDQRDEQFPVGAAARTCPAPETADSVCQPIDSGSVDVSNTVELDVVADDYTRHYTGMLELEREDGPRAPDGLFDQGGIRDRHFMPFFARATEFRLYVFWFGWLREALKQRPGGVPDFRTATPLALYLEDCMGTPARAVRIGLPDLPAVEVLHQNSDMSFGLAMTDTGSALIGDLPEGARSRAIAVAATHEPTGRLVARRNGIHVRPGFITHVWLAPRPAR